VNFEAYVDGDDLLRSIKEALLVHAAVHYATAKNVEPHVAVNTVMQMLEQIRFKEQATQPTGRAHTWLRSRSSQTGTKPPETRS